MKKRFSKTPLKKRPKPSRSVLKLTPALTAEGDEDYVLNEGRPGVWITVDGVSVNVRRSLFHEDLSIERVSVDVYRLGQEMEPPVAMLTSVKRVPR